MGAANPPVATPAEVIKVWTFTQNADGTLSPGGSGGGGGGNVNITGVNSNPPSVSNPLPVELSDGTNAFGTSGNPLSVAIVSGGGSGSNAAAGPTGSAVPASADYLGINIGGTLVGVTGFSLTGSKAAAVAIVDASGNQITSFGGGTQFADNAASGATPTGTLSMGWDSVSSKIRALKVDTSQNLLVSQQGTVTVTGSVNIGTMPAVDVTDRSARLLGHVTVDNATLAVTQSTSPWVNNISQFGGSPVVIGTGVSGLGIPRVTVSSDSLPTTALGGSNLLVGFNDRLLTTLEEILTEVRGQRRLMFMLYEESGEGVPTLMDDPTGPSQADYN